MMLRLIKNNRKDSGMPPQMQKQPGLYLRQSIIVALFCLALGACSFPGVYKINVQQGNIVTQEMLDQLKPGMTRAQVHFVLGNPVVDNVFSKDQEVYFYSYQRAGGETERQKLVVYYEGDNLLRTEGELLDEHPAY